MSNLTITELVKQAGEDNKEKGLHDNPAVTFGDRIALVHGELSEALEEFREGYHPAETYYANTDVSLIKKPEGVPSELADVVIRVADMCYLYGIDLEAAIIEKLAYNKTRPYRHGGNRL